MQECFSLKFRFLCIFFVLLFFFVCLSGKKQFAKQMKEKLLSTMNQRFYDVYCDERLNLFTLINFLHSYLNMYEPTN
jgi:hypothetical protein